MNILDIINTVKYDGSRIINTVELDKAEKEYQKQVLYNFISWYNAKPKVKKHIDCLVTLEVVNEYLK